MSTSLILLLSTLLACGDKNDTGDGTGDGGAGGIDADNDGYTEDVDCIDTNAAVNPGAAEVCNGIDDNCDTLVDDDDPNLDTSSTTTFYSDADGDAYGMNPIEACDRPDGYVTNDLDCNDDAASVNPGATEVCDERDNDCDGLIDDEDDSLDLSTATTAYIDLDGDGYGSEEVFACNVEGAELGGDCNDGDASIYPGAAEVCDGLDNDCDEATTEDGSISVGGVAYTSLTAAIAASAGEEIQLCSGTYSGSYTTTGDVSIVGLHGAEATILEGRGSNSIFTLGGDLSLKGVTVSGGVGTYTGGIDAFTAEVALDVQLEDCVFDGNSGYYGGAILAYNDSSVTATRCSFTNNTASASGGAIYANNMTLVESSFSGNTAIYGGAIMLDSGALTADDATTFESNTATSYGGAILLFGGTTELGASTLISGNTAALGGGLLAQESTDETGTIFYPFTLSGGTFSDNTASSTAGGVYLAGADSVGTGMSISNNTAMYGGGVALEGDGVTLSDSDIFDNVASDQGGGGMVWSYATNAVLEGLTIDSNSASEGGGLYFELATGISLSECDITNNTGELEGGGILVETGSVSFDGGSVTSNVTTDGDAGGAWLTASTLDSVDTDWGERKTDNSPVDIYVDDVATSFAFNGRSSFSCDDTTCE